MAFLEIDNLKKRYGNAEILKGITLDLEEGGFLVLVGPSGCGKSTLLNAIAGLETVSEGEIRLDSVAINTLHPSRRDIAMVFQSYALYPNMTVLENIAFGMKMRGIAKAERDRAVTQVAGTLQISHLLDRRPAQLSGGQRQRVAMGRALVRNPKLFLFDEPLSNLDAKLRVDMRVEIKRLHATTGKTIVYVTHDQIEAMTLATKIAVLKDGVLQQVGTPSEIYNKPANMFVADFMGSPAMNLIRARAEHNGSRLSIRIERTDGDAVILPMSHTMTDHPLADGQDVVFGIRPEAITGHDGSVATHAMVETVNARVEVVEPAGADTFVVTQLGGRQVTARMKADADIRPGQMMPFAFNLDKVVVFDPATGARL